MRPIVSIVLLVVVFLFFAEAARIRKQGPKHFKNYGIGHVRRNASANSGLWPSVFNLATKAAVSVNATCGEGGREEFCRLGDGGKGRCGVCDALSADPSKKHPIRYAVDGTNRWWQSPALFYGPEYEYVTITVDLMQVYQIAYVIVKAATSPRPGSWVLERSLDGENYEPWQYFARSDKECLERFGVPATKGKPHYFTDTEVICTSFYSRLVPLENGEIHTSLVHGRPGANETSPELLEFTKARYVRLRLMGLHGTVEPLPRRFAQDIFKDKRLYYTIRDISIGGQCVCNGHAENCRHNVASGHPECECGHHTCGANCEKCCPMFNQQQWGPGSSRDARQCLPCNCHNHATSCHYDEDVDKAGLSMDIHGNYQGGGVCDNCTAFTMGVNCEQCMPGFFRPFGVARDDDQPCRKCDCHSGGSTGMCQQDGELAGNCECLPGYAGPRCEECADGHRGWPQCESCPCDPRGTAEMADCEGDCRCKSNVEGKMCEQCKSGHFALSAENPEGCTACYCSGVTTICESALITPDTVETLDGWLITDLKISEVAKPSWDDKGLFSIGNYELPDIESFYWLAPQPYLGNKLQFYNSFLTFKVHWVIMRGDTSGKPTTGPNIIIVGNNGLKIAHGNDFFTTSNTTFQIQLREDGWYHIPPEIQDIVTRLKRTQYQGGPVYRRQFLSVLSDIKHILLRATFHTDQIEALLEVASLRSDSVTTAVERCSCPSGYAGLSCESCAFGHVRIMTNASDGISTEQGFCGKCDCNGHSETCNPDTGECFCEHNTVGETCERCKPGYYGNPLEGTETDCKKCACPLEDDDNNFSPSCQLDYYPENEEDEGGYVCTQCPKGYTGDHCEICDDGYFGNPMEVGNSCRLCNCNGGPCDRVTGQCLSCKGNTEGWRCDRCKSGHYGDASASNCISCQCDPLGAVSRDCHNVTGQCQCKERFTGRTCDKCETGYGNVTASCTPCACNPIGSKSDVCDQHTGLCECHKGVEGFHCDACQNLHYGFSDNGCQPCKCDPDGSLFQTCELHTGQCRCRPHYTGLKCDRCESGFWKDGASCVPCNCHPDGATNPSCDPENGFCPCKPGVGGEKCNACLPNHFGTISTGCKACDFCDREGHICHPETGKCVCPPLTTGSKCESCAPNSWGYEPGIGCKACECSLIGASKQQCDSLTGRCTCRIGFEGEKCDRCSHGFYAHQKNCKRCECDPAGTLPEDCIHDSCRCSERGCRCKGNVQGQRCDSCKEGTFGVSLDNPLGCNDCFCFGRSKKCTASNMTWDQIRTDELIPDYCINNVPCWKLPDKFTGDLTVSYGGYLRVSSNSALPFINRVYVTGNGITLESSVKEPDIKITEANWRVKLDRNPPKLPPNCHHALTRPCLMIVLQDVTKIQVETGPSLRTIGFGEILLDKATSLPGILQSASVEQCKCPEEYTSNSCQDPNTGFYRHYPKDHEADNYIDKIIGVARRCQCNGFSDICDKTTGHCFNCTNFTTGPHCELCAEGYYRTPAGHCSPCLCPNEKQNFAKSCRVAGKKLNQFICDCKPGYSGPKCNRCEDQYWGSPEDDGLCQSCNCNPHGSESLVCDKQSGICNCKPGFTGMRCSECVSPREVIQNGVCTACDECTQILFNTIDELWNGVNATLDLFKDGLGPPWDALNETLQRYHLLSKKYDDSVGKATRLINEVNLPEYEEAVERMNKDLKKKNQALVRQTKSIEALQNQSKNITEEVRILYDKIDDIIEGLRGFGNSNIDTQEALREAKRILDEINEKVQYIKSLDNYETVLERCKSLHAQVNEIYNNNDLSPDEIRRQLNDLTKRMLSLNTILDHTDLITKLTKGKNKQNANRLAKLNQTINEINAKSYEVTGDISDLLRKINATNDLLHNTEKIYELLSKVDIDEAAKQLENDLDSASDLYDVLSKVSGHVKDLQDKIKKYKNLFNFTAEEWKKINASGAYDNLVKGIEEAEDSANEAYSTMKEAFAILYPERDDSLPDKTNLAKAFSDRLRQRVINLTNPKKDFKKIEEELEKLKYDILKNGRNNNDLTAVLHNMRQQIKKQTHNLDDLEKVKDDARNISDTMAAIEQKVKAVNITTQYELIKTYHKYLNLTSGDEIDNLKDKILLTRMELQNINTNFTHIDAIKDANDQRFKNTKENFDNVEETIHQLKNKIQFAKEAAESINIAISIVNCTRIYRVQNDVFKSLSITFKCKSCHLFSLTNSRNETISVNVKNRNILLNWKNREERKLKATAETNTITLERIGSVLMFKSDRKEAAPIYDEKLFDIDEGNYLQIGNLLDDGKEGACLHKIVLNDQVLGLWNFAETYGYCAGCQKDVNVTGDEVLFNGNAYRNVTGAGSLKPIKLSIPFQFNTFDENSLIFLAQDKMDHCSYIALNLNDGYLELNVRHLDGTAIKLKSTEKCNNGRKTLVDVAMEYSINDNLQTYSLTPSQSSEISDSKKQTETRPLKSSNVFKIRKSELFIGGIPSTFNKSCIPVNTTPFLGYLKPGNNEFADPSRTTSYNTKLQSGELQFNKVWFPGDGFLELKRAEDVAVPLRVNFLLRPTVANGFVMRIGDKVDIYVKNNNLGLKIQETDQIIESNLSTVNVVDVEVNATEVSVSVNDHRQSFDIPTPMTTMTGVLYLGQDRQKEYPDFRGGISNIVINHKPVSLDVNTIKDFARVEIGRERPINSPPVKMKSSFGSPFETNSMREMQNTEGCPLIASYETDPNAVKFGDKPNSYIFIENSFWKKDYVLEFQFRTFYPNGLLLLAIGAHQQKHYNILDIDDGKLRIRVKGKKIKSITIPYKVNDGNWHHVQISQNGLKKKRKLSIKVDDFEKKPVRMPKNNVKGEFYVGGIPENLPDHIGVKNNLHPFRGCLKSLKINSNLQVLVKNKKNVSYNNIGQCFPNIEKGAYFGGDAYAIYRGDFKVNKVLELSFEFRTVEQNGILLSVSNFGNSPALSVELQNGAVVMTIDMGNGAISNVTNSLDSDFTLCNNHWHNITALYSSSELTVNVDGIRKSWVQSDVNSLMDEIEAPLFVGGLPDNVPSGTLKIKENFKGCIRKLKIEDNLMDWTDMKELNNVLLNSCPVVIS